jgi:hypothetical protein
MKTINVLSAIGRRALLFVVFAVTLFALASGTPGTPQGAPPPPGGAPPPPPGGAPPTAKVWNTFVPLLNYSFTASTFTPDTGLTVTRIQAQVGIAPSGCTTNAVLQIRDSPPAGTPSTVHSLTIANAANDTGSISLTYSAGVPITLSVSTPAQCGWSGQWPAIANVVVQYS